jgi:ribosome recycling factor
MDRATAEQVETIMREVRERLNDSLKIVMKNCEQDEFHLYRRSIGKIMGEIFLEIQEPLYIKHPEITPPGLKQS